MNVVDIGIGGFWFPKDSRSCGGINVCISFVVEIEGCITLTQMS